MFNLKLKPEGFLWDAFEHFDCWLAWTPSDDYTDGGVTGYYQEISLTEVKPRWHRMCIPHGYLNFKGVTWKVRAININTWLIYHIFELHN
jgi:hypothetical protein